MKEYMFWMIWISMLAFMVLPEDGGKIKARFDHGYNLEMARLEALQSEEK